MNISKKWYPPNIGLYPSSYVTQPYIIHNSSGFFNEFYDVANMVNIHRKI
jgi:hypothetical protein